MLPSRGRPGITLLMTVKRELEADDLLRLAAGDDAIPRVGPPVLQRLRASHHAAARYLANGKSIKETAFLVGRTPQRIGDLTRDPTFQELMAYYNNQRAEVDIQTQTRIEAELIEIAELSRDEILDRLEDPKRRAEIPTGELRQLMGDALTRTIAPPKVAQTNVSVPTHITFNVGTKDIRPKDSGQVIEGESEVVETQKQIERKDDGDD